MSPTWAVTIRAWVVVSSKTKVIAVAEAARPPPMVSAFFRILGRCSPHISPVEDQNAGCGGRQWGARGGKHGRSHKRLIGRKWGQLCPGAMTSRRRMAMDELEEDNNDVAVGSTGANCGVVGGNMDVPLLLSPLPDQSGNSKNDQFFCIFLCTEY